MGGNLNLPPLGVYAISPSVEGPTKIGVAHDPEKRMSDMQTACWQRLYLMQFNYFTAGSFSDMTGNARRVEKRTHKVCKERGEWLRGEWLDLPPRIAWERAQSAAVELGLGNFSPSRVEVLYGEALDTATERMQFFIAAAGRFATFMDRERVEIDRLIVRG